MYQYDLNIFSPNEFEEFSRDILQAKFGKYIESFKTGKDGGIDLRYSKSNGLNTIIQCKRYKDFNSLISNLKKEVTKVNKLNPCEYIITTSLELSPSNKEVIKSLFAPYIKSTEDIYGKEDLLNLLSQHKKIEEKYYKLWIASTAILEKVLHSKIYNQSRFELEEINHQAKLYVQNKSFNEALNILNEYRYIIISGIPGIGKTTLSRILTFYLLANGYEEFVYLNDKIDDGYAYFKEEKKQIFLFDDFLGKNFFEADNSPKNHDNVIIKFINKIKNSPDKILILATREYILNRAREVYEAFKIYDVEIAKCVIDLSSYTNLIKAKILYNHLYFGDIPEDYILEIIKNKNYIQLISHPNFSPRIIEAFITQKIWKKCKPNDFFNVIKALFDNPESVWLHSFENSLDKFSQYVLLILSTLGTPVLLSDLELAVQSFFYKNNYKTLLNFDSIKFHKSIRELENTFIRTNSDKNGNISVEYQNPSIYDFITNYLLNKNSVIKDLIDSIIFVDQTYKIFCGIKTSGKIQLISSLIDDLADRILEIENELNSCNLYNTSRNEGVLYKVNDDFIYKFLNYLAKHYSNSLKIKEFINRKLAPIIEFKISVYKTDFLELLISVDLSKFTFNEERLINSFFCHSYCIDDIALFTKIKNIFPKTYDAWINSVHFKRSAEEIIIRELNDVISENAREYKFKIKNISTIYSLELEAHLKKLDIMEMEYNDYIEHQIDMYTSGEFHNFDSQNISEDITINEIFNSLKE